MRIDYSHVVWAILSLFISNFWKREGYRQETPRSSSWPIIYPSCKITISYLLTLSHFRSLSELKMWSNKPNKSKMTQVQWRSVIPHPFQVTVSGRDPRILVCMSDFVQTLSSIRSWVLVTKDHGSRHNNRWVSFLGLKDQEKPKIF